MRYSILLTVFLFLFFYNCSNLENKNPTISTNDTSDVNDKDTTYLFFRPRAGEIISHGKPYQLTWGVDYNQFGRAVDFYLFLGVDSCFQLAGESFINDGSEIWNIPEGLSTGNNYKIKGVSTLNNGIYSFSDSFTIVGLEND